ncbi:hypothetical protein HN51_002257 [Arachis hypogaea]
MRRQTMAERRFWCGKVDKKASTLQASKANEHFYGYCLVESKKRFSPSPSSPLHPCPDARRPQEVCHRQSCRVHQVRHGPRPWHRLHRHFVVAKSGHLLSTGQLSNIIGVPTFKRTKEQALSLEISLSVLDNNFRLDLVIDGADEVDPTSTLTRKSDLAMPMEVVQFCEKYRSCSKKKEWWSMGCF